MPWGLSDELLKDTIARFIKGGNPDAVRPNDDYIFVRVDDAEKTSRGGVVIPDNAQKKLCQGVVLATGPGPWSKDGTRRLPMSTKVGERVIYGPFGGSDRETRIDGQVYRFVRDAECFAVLEEVS